MHQILSCNIQGLSQGFGKTSWVSSPHQNTVNRLISIYVRKQATTYSPTFAQTQSFRF
jgi:hypothetical protein